MLNITCIFVNINFFRAYYVVTVVSALNILSSKEDLCFMLLFLKKKSY